jgi:uncharacterized protein (DUF2147 family)
MTFRPIALGAAAHTLCLGAPAMAQAPTAGTAKIVGIWRAKTENAVVQIDPCGASFCGRVLTSDHLKASPDALDIRNRNASLRGRKIMGLAMLQGFTGGPDAWKGGTVYNPDDGGTYSGIIRRRDDDHLKLVGCIIYPLCKSEIWTRMK